MSTAPSSMCVKRLQKEFKAIMKEPPAHIQARPDDSNILLWYYVLEGPADTPYEGGIYIGKVRFPPEYPMAPPSIMMVTPSGRFRPDTRLCLSMSDFHPKEWNPLWSVSTILSGLLSFMLEERVTYGSIETTVAEKKELAVASHSFNSSNALMERHFPEVHKRCCRERERVKAIVEGVDESDSSPTNGKTSLLKDDTIREAVKQSSHPSLAPTATPKSPNTWLDTLVRLLQLTIVGSVMSLIGYVLTM